MMTLDNEVYDQLEKAEWERERAIKQRCVQLEQEEDGHTHRDPETGDLYTECVACGALKDDDEMHSGGECNFCHACHEPAEMGVNYSKERAAKLAELYLKAIALGVPCADLAKALAEAVLNVPVIKLARKILEGPATREQATDLAESVLQRDVN